jgi:hypothetical protein
MWGWEEMVLKCKLCENIPLHVQELNCEEGVYELEYQVGEEAWGLYLLPKLGLIKNKIIASFPNRLLKNT